LSADGTDDWRPGCPRLDPPPREHPPPADRPGIEDRLEEELASPPICNQVLRTRLSLFNSRFVRRGDWLYSLSLTFSSQFRAHTRHQRGPLEQQSDYGQRGPL